ncbi:MAG TPA: hypothetical protein VI814_08595 [Candidatus Limnocylindria bacterium]
MGRRGRTLVAGIDTVLMGAAAFTQTGIPKAIDAADLVLWGAAVAAAVCAFVIYSSGMPVLAWLAIGYVLFGGLLTRGSPHWPLVALAVALMPLVPRPRGSLATGLGIALLFAIAARFIIAAIV